MTEVGQGLRSSDTSMESVILKKSSTGKPYDLDPRNDFITDDGESIGNVDSDEISSTKFSNTDNIPFYQQLFLRMNPADCLSPAVSSVADASFSAVHACTTNAYNSCLASDREEFEFLLQDILKDIRVKYIGVAIHKSNKRTAALQRLYRLTDREHAHNRYVVGRIGYRFTVTTNSSLFIYLCVHTTQNPS